MNTAKMTDDLIERGVRQKRIAEYCGVNQSTVSRWRKGTDPEGPSRDRLFQLYEETFGPGSLLEIDAEDDEALTARLLESFRRIKDPKLKMVALRQIGALADQSPSAPAASSSDRDAQPKR